MKLLVADVVTTNYCTKYSAAHYFTGKERVLARAICTDNVDSFQEIINQQRIDVNHISPISGYTFLMYAEAIENLNAMSMLLFLGANPNLPSPLIKHEIYTPVRYAVKKQNFEMLRLLIEYKASLNPVLGSSPLACALSINDDQSSRKMMQFLVENGADVNHLTYDGNLLLAMAFRANRMNVVDYLLDQGADPLLKGINGENFALIIQRSIVQLEQIDKINSIYYQNLLKLWQRIEKGYNVQLPLEIDKLYPLEFFTKKYEALNTDEQNILGERERKRYERSKKALEKIHAMLNLEKNHE